MLLSNKTNGALNGQINAELYSSYLYLSMSAYFESIEMRGLASWMRVQAAEELVHAMKMYDYIIGSGGRGELLAIEAPTRSWDSPLHAIENVFGHEKKVTGLIQALMEVAVGEKDDATAQFLRWYVDEQVEEEESAKNVLDKVRDAGTDPNKLKTVDEELGQRGFKFPRGYTIF